ncbi:hypothetical protein ACIF8T_34210 [Streptomyces sp. NPDC085946]|uniref:hypothetical protein n=1 Tax=Streptomyces sp. NPDC085946 TaxID=3365744 RepID=UPI0037D9427F
MAAHPANGDPRLSLWRRVREFAVPPSMIETATARRHAGDWAGACAAAGIDVDLHPRSLARTHGRDLAARVRDDLRHLAPDLLRWHLPRIAPDGLLRPGLTLTLARYDTDGPHGAGPVHLVVRTPPAWADGGQRFGLALWDGTRPTDGAGHHPHPRPDRRFRLDLHRHLWDARRTGELRARSGADLPPAGHGPDAEGPPAGHRPDTGRTPAAHHGCPVGAGPEGRHRAVERWADEAALLLRAEGRPAGGVTVRLGARRWLVVDPAADRGAPRITAAPAAGGVRALPVLPDAATWVPPDLALLRAGLVEPGRLHPLVASALVPGVPAAGPSRAPLGPGRPWLVECRGARHRVGLVDGVLVALDHDPAELRREELLVALTGTPLPCLRFIDRAHRRPDCLADIRERLGHGDTAGALAAVEGLLGPGAVPRDGALRDALEAAAQRRIAYGLYRAGLGGALPGSGPGPLPGPPPRLGDVLYPGPGGHRPDRRRSRRDRPRRTTTR